MESIHRRNLPHWYMPGAAHFVTYRIAGRIPFVVIKELQDKKDRLLTKPSDLAPGEYRAHVNKILFAAYDDSLDQATGERWLQDACIASMLRENLYHHNGTKYCLHSFCIMPNHVHVLFTPSPSELSRSNAITDFAVGEQSDEGSPLSRIMHSLKSYTANRANQILVRTGSFWQSESYDHWVRDASEMERIVDYIRANPVKAGLVAKHEDWFWSSCHDRFLMDGETCGWLTNRNTAC